MERYLALYVCVSGKVFVLVVLLWKGLCPCECSMERYLALYVRVFGKVFVLVSVL